MTISNLSLNVPNTRNHILKPSAPTNASIETSTSEMNIVGEGRSTKVDEFDLEQQTLSVGDVSNIPRRLSQSRTNAQLEVLNYSSADIKNDGQFVEHAELENEQSVEKSNHFEVLSYDLKDNVTNMQGKHIDVKYSDLSKNDFDKLQKHYGNTNAEFVEAKDYSLKDFLPLEMQALHLTRFHSEIMDNVFGDKMIINEFSETYPDLTDNQNNCFGVAIEFARKKAHPESKLYSYNLDRLDAGTLFDEHFDLIEQVSVPEFVQSSSKELKAGDMVVIYNGSDEHMSEPMHASTYIGAPELSDGSQALNGQLFIEKRDSSDQDPLYITDLNGFMKGYSEFEDWSVRVLRQKEDAPLDIDPLYKKSAGEVDGKYLPENVYEVGLGSAGGGKKAFTYFRLGELPLVLDDKGQGMLSPEVFDGSLITRPEMPVKYEYTSSPKKNARIKIQEILNENGASLVIDGILGQGSKEAIRKFQENHNLEVTGIVDQQTWDLLLK